MLNLPQTANSVEFLFLDSSGNELYENFNKKCVKVIATTAY